MKVLQPRADLIDKCYVRSQFEVTIKWKMMEMIWKRHAR